MRSTTTKNNIVSVLNTRYLTNSTYVLRLERGDLEFEAGQYVSLGLPGNAEKREYSIYSGVNDDYLEVLVKEIDEGLVSKQLKQLQTGAHAEMDGPFGFFTLRRENLRGHGPVFIASGTGIAPFHSIIRTYPDLRYTLIHGVRNGEEAYDRTAYDRERYVLCTSREDSGNFDGRVTDYMKMNPREKNCDYYLCGNSNMIHEMYDILREQGVETDRIHAEVYF